MIGGAAGGGLLTGTLRPAAALRAEGGAAEAEQLDVAVGAAADELGHVDEQHQGRRQPHLSRPEHSAKSPHSYMISRYGPPRQAVFSFGCRKAWFRNGSFAETRLRLGRAEFSAKPGRQLSRRYPLSRLVLRRASELPAKLPEGVGCGTQPPSLVSPGGEPCLSEARTPVGNKLTAFPRLGGSGKEVDRPGEAGYDPTMFTLEYTEGVLEDLKGLRASNRSHILDKIDE
jgi:hypothetical protein